MKTGVQADQSKNGYIGRFAPSPSGPLHWGSITTAVGSYLDARAHDGVWLIRIEDIDPPRAVDGATEQILTALANLQMQADQPVSYQSDNDARYRQALHQLHQMGRLYPCDCSRRIIAQFHQENSPDKTGLLPGSYPGLCRAKQSDTTLIRELINAPAQFSGGQSAFALRVRVDPKPVHWHDRPAGFADGKIQTDNLANDPGDFIVRRADRLWSYQLAVVVDDQHSGITDVVRGTDLADSTARQRFLQQCLGFHQPSYLHLPLVLTESGTDKLSKQTGAKGVQTDISEQRKIELLNQALAHLQLAHVTATSLRQFWEQATNRWRESAWMLKTPPAQPGG